MPKAVEKWPNLPVTWISCPLGWETEDQLVECNYASRFNYSFSINLDPTSTQSLDMLQMRKWDSAFCRGRRRRVNNPRLSRLRPDRLNPKLKNGIVMSPYTMDAATTIDHLELVDQVHTIHALSLLHYMLLSSFETSASSMQATTVTLNSGSRYNIIRCSALPLGWQRHLCPDYKTSPARNANKTLYRFHQLFSFAYDAEMLSTRHSFDS